MYKLLSNNPSDNEFKKPVGECSIVGLIATDKLTEGFDQSDVDIAVSARPFSKSFSSHVQQMGRPMRKHPGKSFATWICHSGNYLRFLDQWEDLYHNGVTSLDDGAEKTKPEPSKEQKDAAKCPKCGLLWETKGDTCTHCGFTRPRRNTVIELSGTVEELAPVQKKGKEATIEKMDFYAQLLGYAKQKGYKEGFAYHALKEKFGSYPHKKPEPKPPTREVLNWITYRAIKQAKGKKS